MTIGVFVSMLNNNFTVERRVRVSDGMGGWAISYVAAGSITGRIRPKTTAERLVAESEEAQITHTLYCLAGEDIARGDLVTCSGGVGSGTLVVEVLGVREPSEAGEHWEIDCLERQNEETGELGS